MTAPRMTPTNDAPVTVPVNDDDREAAADLAHALGMDCETFTSGAAEILVQHLARRRLAALARPHSAVAPAGEGVERELTPMLIASARGHLANVKAHGNAEANACIVFEAVLDAAAALARPRAAVGEQSREAIARICYVPNRVALGPVEAAFRLAAKQPTSSTGRCVAAAYDRADAILALQSPPAKVEG